MKKQVKTKERYSVIDFIGLTGSLVFLVSVIQNVNVAAFNSYGQNVLDTRFGAWGDAPNSVMLTIFLVAFLYSLYKRRRVSTIQLIALIVVLTSLAVWIIGLHTHFS